MKQTVAIIDQAMREHPRAVVAVSGGDDSAVLVDVIYTRTKHRPPLHHIVTGLDYPGTVEHIQQNADRLGAELHLTETPVAPLETWKRHGWPMLGKMADRDWNRAHRGLGFGFKCNRSDCCRRLKITPARRWMKEHGFTLTFTGVRGGIDDAARRLQERNAGAIYYSAQDDVTIATPLVGWTDTMVKRYTAAQGLKRHPMKLRGAESISCTPCGGGAKFIPSNYASMRRLSPATWRRWIVDASMGEIILAIKYDEPILIVRAALAELGGLARVARTRPWVFDYLRDPPLAGYTGRVIPED